MKTRLTHRIFAALASTIVTFALFSAVVSEADFPVDGVLIAQATPMVVVR